MNRNSIDLSVLPGGGRVQQLQDLAPDKQVPNILFTNNFDEASAAVKEGYEPVEWADGKHSLVGPLILDHHGKYSKEPPVSIKAARMALQGRRGMEDFVVMGLPDADAVLTIGYLSGLIEPNLAIAQAVATLDLDPVGVDRCSGEYIREIVFEHLSTFENSLQGYIHGLQAAMFAFEPAALSEEIILIAKELERQRFVRNESEIVEINNGVVFAVSDTVGRDVWHTHGDLLVQYKPSMNVLTVSGCSLRAAELLGRRSVYDILGSQGLGAFYPKIDALMERPTQKKAGGREEIGGGPRGYEVSYDEAVAVFNELSGLVGSIL